MSFLRSTERQGKPSIRLAALVASTALILAGVAFLRDGWLAEPLIAGPWFVGPLIAVGFAVAIYGEIVAEVRGERIAIQLTEIPFVFGLVYLNPWQLALAWVFVNTAANSLRRRSSWIKAMVNSANIFLRVGIASVIVHAIFTGFDSAMSLAALTIGVTVGETAGLFTITAFVRWVESRPFSGIATDVRGAGFSAIGATIGSWGVVAGLWSPVLLILPLMVVALWWYSSRQQMRDRQAYEDLKEVHGFLQSVAQTKPAQVLSEGLEALRSVLSCEWAAVLAADTEVLGFTSRSGLSLDGDLYEHQHSFRRQLSAGHTVLLGPSLRSPSKRGKDSLFSTAVDLFESALRRADLQLRIDFEAAHDPVTGLLARRAFIQAADLELDASGGVGAILVVDLTRFGEVNKTLGFKAGDILLRQTGQQLAEATPLTSLTARLNADSFAVFLPNGEQQVALDVAGRIRSDLSRPVEVNGLTLTPLCRIGIAVGPVHGNNAEQLLRAADVASALASDMRPPVTIYRIESDVHSEAKLELLTRLKEALEAEKLDVWFQPKVDAISGRTVGAEALLRWQDGDRWISPELFIPAAEAAGMMNDLTDMVLKKALSSVATWRADGHHLGVAVNLSPSSLEDPGLPGRIAAELRRFQIDPPTLTIEITESVVMGMGSIVTTGLARLRALGIRISVDDFGTGYSSLRYLKDLDIDELKLDRSFVQDLSVSDRSATIARAVIGLGHSLGLQVVAEGVETLEAQQLLNEMGCDVLQGFLIARPMDRVKLDRWLPRHARNIQMDRPSTYASTDPAGSFE